MTPPIRLLCEGVSDRDFLAGYLLGRGWVSGRRKRPRSGEQIGPGVHFYTRGREPTGQELFVHQTQGVDNMAAHGKTFLDQLNTKAVSLLLLHDDDTSAAAAPRERKLQQLAELMGESLQAKDGCTTISGARCAEVAWRTSDPAGTVGVPDKQTLERLICSAFAEADPSRAASVQQWLEHEPRGSSGPKAHAYSFFAKYSARDDETDFFQGVWRNEALENLLRTRIDACGLGHALDFLAPTVVAETP